MGKGKKKKNKKQKPFYDHNEEEVPSSKISLLGDICFNGPDGISEYLHLCRWLILEHMKDFTKDMFGIMIVQSNKLIVDYIQNSFDLLAYMFPHVVAAIDTVFGQIDKTKEVPVTFIFTNNCFYCMRLHPYDISGLGSRNEPLKDIDYKEHIKKALPMKWSDMNGIPRIDIQMKTQALIIGLDPCINYTFFSSKNLAKFESFLGKETLERVKSAVSKKIEKGIFYTNVGVKSVVNNSEYVVFYGLLTYFEDSKGMRIARLSDFYFNTLSHSKAFVFAFDMIKKICSKTAEILIFEYIPDPVASDFFMQYGCVLNLIDNDINEAAQTLIRQTKQLQSSIWVTKDSPLTRLKKDKGVTFRNGMFTWFIILDEDSIHKDEIGFDCKCN